MARIRTIKPEFFRHEDLFEAEKASGLPLRIAFAGLWTVADRDGRFRWRPRVMKLDIMPFDDVDFEMVLNELAAHGFIVKYQFDGEIFAHIPKWSKHQHVNQREAGSDIPAPAEGSASTCDTIPARVEGKGREQEGERKDAPLSTATRGGLTPERRREIRDQVFAAVGITENPNPSMQNISPIIEMMDKGYDLQKDILPVMESIRARGTVTPTTYAYYVKAITENKSKNGAIPAKSQSKPGPPTTWIDVDDPRWLGLSQRWKQERGRAPPIAGSKYHPGQGFAFPAEWIPVSTLIPTPVEVPFGDGK